MNPYVCDLALYDLQGTPGVAADISHINSKAKTKVVTLTSIICTSYNIDTTMGLTKLNVSCSRAMLVRSSWGRH